MRPIDIYFSGISTRAARILRSEYQQSRAIGPRFECDADAERPLCTPVARKLCWNISNVHISAQEEHTTLFRYFPILPTRPSFVPAEVSLIWDHLRKQSSQDRISISSRLYDEDGLRYVSSRVPVVCRTSLPCTTSIPSAHPPGHWDDPRRSSRSFRYSRIDPLLAGPQNSADSRG